jgi:hypothetical protein
VDPVASVLVAMEPGEGVEPPSSTNQAAALALSYPGTRNGLDPKGTNPGPTTRPPGVSQLLSCRPVVSFDSDRKPEGLARILFRHAATGYLRGHHLRQIPNSAQKGCVFCTALFDRVNKSENTAS